MESQKSCKLFLLGLFIFLGFTSLGFLLGQSIVKFKELDRTITVKGLSEKEENADIVIWPIQFTELGNDLTSIYNSLDKSSNIIKSYLISNQVKDEEITFSQPSIIDKYAHSYGDTSKAEYRYTATQTITIYSSQVEKVRSLINKVSELGKQGIAFNASEYNNQIEYLYTSLNLSKPQMIEDATRSAREVAIKFAKDSSSKLGKIKKASQGQFTIEDRDKNNPHIKKIRVVSTIEYYLAD